MKITLVVSMTNIDERERVREREFILLSTLKTQMVSNFFKPCKIHKFCEHNFAFL